MLIVSGDVGVGGAHDASRMIKDLTDHVIDSRCSSQPLA